MSIEALNWASKQADLPSAAKFILQTLALSAGENGRCWYGIDTLCQLTNLTRATVKRHLAAMVGSGHITRERRYKDGRRTSSLTTLLLSPILSPKHESLGLNMSPNGVENESLGLKLIPRLDIDTNSIEKKKKRRPDRPPCKEGTTLHVDRHRYVGAKATCYRSDDFQEWWKAYPKRKQRSNAMAWWDERCDTDTLPPQAELMTVLEQQKKTQSWKQEIGKWVPWPGKYLANAMFEDEISRGESWNKDGSHMDSDLPFWSRPADKPAEPVQHAEPAGDVTDLFV